MSRAIAPLIAILSLALRSGATDLWSAQVLLQAGKAREALQAFKKLNGERDGRCAACLLGMAEASIPLREFGDARKYAEKAAQLAGADAGLRARALNGYGVAIISEARDDKALARAEAAFREAVQADSGLLNARLNLGHTLLRRSRDAEGLAELQAFLDRAPPGPALEKARALVANPRRARERFAPEFSTRTLDGEAISLASFGGKVLLLDFWATWCGPCVDAVPEIKELRRQYPTERLAIVSVSVDDEAETARAFVAKHGMSWTQCHDAQGALREAFDVHSFPTYLVIDGEGAIMAEIHGTDPRASLKSRLRETLKRQLAP